MRVSRLSAPYRRLLRCYRYHREKYHTKSIYVSAFGQIIALLHPQRATFCHPTRRAFITFAEIPCSRIPKASSSFVYFIDPVKVSRQCMVYSQLLCCSAPPLISLALAGIVIHLLWRNRWRRGMALTVRLRWRRGVCSHWWARRTVPTGSRILDIGYCRRRLVGSLKIYRG